MNILYISNSLIPSRSANSIHVMKMCQAIAENGHNVILTAPKIQNTKINVQDIYKFYGVNKLFFIKKIFWGDYKGRDYVYGLLAALLSFKVKSDLVYGRSLHGCYISALLGKPVIYEIHEPIRKVDLNLFQRLVNNKNFKRLTVISEALKKYFQEEQNIPDHKILVAHDGADKANLLEKIDFPKKDKLHVGYIGHLYQGRGINIIIEMAEKCSWAHFHLIGGTEEDINYWKQKAQNISNITFHGFVPHSQTDAYRNSCDVLLAPYQKKVTVYGGSGDTSKWMSPLKIFEYMAAGKPIICSNLPVLQEVLTNGKNSLLCDPKDIEQWVKALNRLRNDQKIKKYLGETAQKVFLKKYTWQARAKDVLQNL